MSQGLASFVSSRPTFPGGLEAKSPSNTLPARSILTFPVLFIGAQRYSGFCPPLTKCDSSLSFWLQSQSVTKLHRLNVRGGSGPVRVPRLGVWQPENTQEAGSRGWYRLETSAPGAGDRRACRTEIPVEDAAASQDLGQD